LVRGILALALALGSIGAVVTGTMAHGSTGHGKVAINHHWMV